MDLKEVNISTKLSESITRFLYKDGLPHSEMGIFLKSSSTLVCKLTELLSCSKTNFLKEVLEGVERL